ncbi:hypothetical protein GCM10023195_01400 [Actinoallomurus liliacearum]|uniref:Hemerythrin-like domain-containing protein n=1 Tax=Actinoallomurus liliacearum TaxID=1080073 RepID=A0ABP8T8P5_9ACTN
MIDMTLMYATHDAFRRDLRRLTAVASGQENGMLTARAPIQAGWADFFRFLTVHHEAEDAVLWPTVRAKLGGRPADLRLLDAMEAEHAALDPPLAGVEAALAGGDLKALAEHVGALATALAAHLDHEEADALPLIHDTLTEEEWARFGNEQRRRLGLSGGAVYFPWLLDEMPEQRESQVLSVLPSALRLVYRVLWRPRYARRLRWTA